MDIVVGKLFHDPKTFMGELLFNDVLVLWVNMGVSTVTILDLAANSVATLLVLQKRSFVVDIVSGSIMGSLLNLRIGISL